MTKLKQKSITMWAMYHCNKMMFWFGTYNTRKQAWKTLCYMNNVGLSHKKRFKKDGWKAVKGKFVWEEK